MVPCRWIDKSAAALVQSMRNSSQSCHAQYARGTTLDVENGVIPGELSMIGSSELNLDTKARSMRSFHCQSQGPLRTIQPLLAMADRSPVDTRLSQDLCGWNARSGWPSRWRRKLSAKGSPWRTAKTPAFGRGSTTLVATSPAANTLLGPLADCRNSLMAKNPSCAAQQAHCLCAGDQRSNVSHTCEWDIKS
jgi:hypothetical protein